MDLERPAQVRKIFNAISSQDVTGEVLNVYGEDLSPQILFRLTITLNQGQRLSLWDKAGMLYDEFGAGNG